MWVCFSYVVCFSRLFAAYGRRVPFISARIRQLNEERLQLIDKSLKASLLTQSKSLKLQQDQLKELMQVSKSIDVKADLSNFAHLSKSKIVIESVPSTGCIQEESQVSDSKQDVEEIANANDEKHAAGADAAKDEPNKSQVGQLTPGAISHQQFFFDAARKPSYAVDLWGTNGFNAAFQQALAGKSSLKTLANVLQVKFRCRLSCVSTDLVTSLC